MRRQDTFSAYHPLVNLSYFIISIGTTMFFMHPVMLCISLICAVIYSIILNGVKMIQQLKFMLPLLLLISVMNPLFNHQGKTILCYLPSDNPLTLESIIYGIASGIMLAAILLWFVCFMIVFPSEKFIYLFGKILPSLSLVLSMTLRLVPKFRRQLHEICDAQRALGNDITKGNILCRTKTALSIFSVLITWSLEDSIDTADSMKNRGYGTKKRTSFYIYKWKTSDTISLIYLLILGVIEIFCIFMDDVHWQYFPEISGDMMNVSSMVLYTVFLGICLIPIYLNAKEALKWHKLS